MQLSSQDVKSIGLTAFGGFVIAGFLGVFNSIVEKKWISELLVETKNLHSHDKLLLMQLSDLQKIIGKIYPIDFAGFINSCDNLITIKLQISILKQKDPLQNLTPLRDGGFFMLNLAKRKLKIILSKSQASLSPQLFNMCENIAQQISLQLEEHFSAIMLLTS